MNEARARFIQGLRELADYLEQHPEVPTPTDADQPKNINRWADNRQHFRQLIAQLQPLGFTRKQDDTYFRLVLVMPSGGVSYEVLNLMRRRIPLPTEDWPEPLKED